MVMDVFRFLWKLATAFQLRHPGPISSEIWLVVQALVFIALCLITTFPIWGPAMIVGLTWAQRRGYVKNETRAAKLSMRLWEGCLILLLCTPGPALLGISSVCGHDLAVGLRILAIYALIGTVGAGGALFAEFSNRDCPPFWRTAKR